MLTFKMRTLATCIGLIGSVGIAHGAGFNLLEQNASGLGTAYAGSAAIADNASTIYFNPAGMTRLPGLNISLGANLIGPSFKFENDGNSSLPTAFRTNPGVQLGGNGGNAGGWGFVPNMYLSYQATDRVYLGLGVGAPFGLKTEYDKDWMGRYHSQSFDIKTININPSIAFKVTPSLSLGAGFNIQRIDATYEKATPVPLGPVAAPFYGAPYVSGDVKTRVKNTGYGWNVGLMYEPSEDTRIGLSYRSRVKHKATGDTDLSFMVPGRGVMARSSEAKATVSLPDTFVLSAYQRLDPRWELLGDISWTGWSSIPTLKIVNPSLSDAELNLKFKDAWRIAVGAQYQLNDSWKLKGGLAWDQSPVRKASYRPASLPDNDRYWISLGAQYKPSENTTLDFGYSLLVMPGNKVDNNNDNQAQYGRLSGKYKGNAHILGLQLSHRF